MLRKQMWQINLDEPYCMMSACTIKNESFKQVLLHMEVLLKQLNHYTINHAHPIDVHTHCAGAIWGWGLFCSGRAKESV